MSKQHRDWRFWQDYFTDYKASLSFNNLREMTDFLISEYNLGEGTHEAVTDSINRIDADLIVLDINTTNEALLSFREFIPPIKPNAL